MLIISEYFHSKSIFNCKLNTQPKKESLKKMFQILFTVGFFIHFMKRLITCGCCKILYIIYILLNKTINILPLLIQYILKASKASYMSCIFINFEIFKEEKKNTKYFFSLVVFKRTKRAKRHHIHGYFQL